MKRLLAIGACLVLTACETDETGLQEAPPLPGTFAAPGQISQEILGSGLESYAPADTPEQRANELNAELTGSDTEEEETETSAAPLATASSQFGLSDENDFDAVSGRQSIESDAERLALNRERYTLIEPTDLPQRPGETGPNIVAYALATNNPVGEPLYRRFLLFMTAEKYLSNCAAFASADLAQIAFLKAGGPEDDRLGLDPDGDGFACTWDPSVFRSIGGN